MQQQVICNDFDRLAATIATVRAGIVMIDGCTLAGKTRLGCMLARRLHAASIDADCYIEPRQDAFVSALRVSELKTVIHAVLSLPKVALVSGVCARDVAERVGIVPALFIYVQRNTAVGIEGDMDIIDAEDGVEPDFPVSPLDAEIIDYHRRRQPRRNADIVYIRVEPDPLAPC